MQFHDTSNASSHSPSNRAPPADSQIRAADLDASGRRLDSGRDIEEGDSHEIRSDKDVLPAYEAAGSPPVYMSSLQANITDPSQQH
jgi:hypothetical protein